MKNKQQKNRKKNSKNQYFNIVFLSVIIALYFILFFLNSKKLMNALNTSWNIFLSIIPIFVIVIILMGVSNLFLKPKKVKKYLGEKSGLKGWFLSAAFGILSHGPIYVWFPLLKDLKSHGMRTGLVAVFLYNRAIKIPLLPVMIFYFGVYFVILLTVFMILASMFQGKLIEILDNRAASI
jgi:uncharacterized membrane protein YraQ (UPF0718 family)